MKKIMGLALLVLLSCSCSMGSSRIIYTVLPDNPMTMQIVTTLTYVDASGATVTLTNQMLSFEEVCAAPSGSLMQLTATGGQLKITDMTHLAVVKGTGSVTYLVP